MEKRLMTLMAALFLFIGGALAQTKVNGTVVSQDDGQPVIGATVQVIGTQVGTVTNADGKFSLTVPAGKSMLRITYVGMDPLEVSARPNMRIFLTSDQAALDEVIVIGYGTAKKSAFTGSATEVGSVDIASHVTANAANALVGKVAGVTATSTSGAPGSAPTIRIRGIGSYAASSTPLYIVDGVPTEMSLSTINPEDIESMSVLKDASASAIYGNRGANGVVIITTKKAKNKQDAEVKFDAKWGSNSRLIPQYDIIKNPAEYYEAQYRAMYNSQYYHGATAEEAYAYADKNILDPNNGGLGVLVYTVPDDEKLIGTNFKLNPNAKLGYSDGEYTYLPDDWYDELFHSSFRQEYNASVSGSTGKLSYYASVGFLNDGGQVKNSNYRRYTGRTNVEYQAKSWLKLTTNMSFGHTISQTPSYSSTTYGSSTNLFYYANSMGAIYPLYLRDKDGNIMTQNGHNQFMRNANTNQTRPSFLGNAAEDNEYNDYNSYSDIFTGQWAAVITPIEGLNLTAQLSATSYNNRGTYLYSTFAQSGGSVDGTADVDQSRTMAVNQQYLANYTHTFNDVHNLSVLLGYEQYQVKDQYLEGVKDHLFDPFIGELNNATAHDNEKAYSYTDNYMTEGFFGRVNYDYDNKYFLNASLRRDASSKFAPGHRWGTFWSAGFAWQMNKEKFMEDLKWINMLKLRVSYGENGNDRGMNYYAYADQYSTAYNKDTGEYSLTMYRLGNENLTWETKKSWDAGIDFALFNNRLTGSLDVYTGTTSDLLWEKNLPSSSGKTVNYYYTNIGAVRNSGIELALEGTIIRQKDLSWSLNLALAHNKNKITELDPTIAKYGQRSSNRILKVGGSLQHAYMIQYAGVNEQGQAQYWKDTYVYELDENGNKTSDIAVDGDGNYVVEKSELTTNIDEATRRDCGDILPKLQGGFGTTVNAYGFDLSAQFSFQLGGKFYDGAYQQLMHNGQEVGHAMHRDLLNAWSPENTGSDIPRLSTASVDDPGSGSQTPMDRFLTSSDYLCLNNLSLGYTLPKSLITPLTLRNVRVYVAGENLFLLTARKGMDPRYNLGIGGYTSGGGLASGSYSAMRSITAGLTVTF